MDGRSGGGGPNMVALVHGCDACTRCVGGEFEPTAGQVGRVSAVYQARTHTQLNTAKMARGTLTPVKKRRLKRQSPLAKAVEGSENGQRHTRQPKSRPKRQPPLANAAHQRPMGHTHTGRLTTTAAHCSPRYYVWTGVGCVASLADRRPA
uniref:Uncharacterized protein n=1 Tax=Plectus sambesii TaxID=2011161 RepID=A0A914X8V3_9BILA